MRRMARRHNVGCGSDRPCRVHRRRRRAVFYAGISLWGGAIGAAPQVFLCYCQSIWRRLARCRLRYAKRLASRIKVFLSFLAMTSRMIPATISNSPAMTSMTAPMSVGNRATRPVAQNSDATCPQRMIPTMPIIEPNPPKKGSGLYSRIMRKIVDITFTPSPTVLSLLTDPAGRSRY